MHINSVVLKSSLRNDCSELIFCIKNCLSSLSIFALKSILPTRSLLTLDRRNVGMGSNVFEWSFTSSSRFDVMALDLDIYKSFVSKGTVDCLLYSISGPVL